MENLEIEKEIKRQLEVIKLGVDEIISEEDLVKKLRKSLETNTPLKIKLGIDPTGSDLHIGHAVPIRKLKAFKELGHSIYLVIGTFTGQIGDPTGKSSTRKMLDFNEIQENIKTYMNQISKIMDVDDINVVYNHEWFDKMKLSDFLYALSTITVSQMISREDFSKRLRENKPVSLVEFMYPVLQGYDSVELEADVELGATEQRFNLLKGRDLQKSFNKESQVCILLPILEGLDGVEKMSKSLNNYIALNDTSNDMYGKIMSISDELMLKYYDYLTDFSVEKINKIKNDIKNNNIHPMEAKKILAESLVRVYFGEEEGKKAREWFENVFVNKNNNVDLIEIEIVEEKLTILDLISKYTNIYKSNSEIRRVINQGGAKINGETINDIKYELNIKDGDILKLGKKSIYKLIKKGTK